MFVWEAYMWDGLVFSLMSVTDGPWNVAGYNYMTQLIALEDFINVSRIESITSREMTNLIFGLNDRLFLVNILR
jgi:hypothetical protein